MQLPDAEFEIKIRAGYDSVTVSNHANGVYLGVSHLAQLIEGNEVIKAGMDLGREGVDQLIDALRIARALKIDGLIR